MGRAREGAHPPPPSPPRAPPGLGPGPMGPGPWPHMAPYGPISQPRCPRPILVNIYIYIHIYIYIYLWLRDVAVLVCCVSVLIRWRFCFSVLRFCFSALRFGFQDVAFRFQGVAFRLLRFWVGVAPFLGWGAVEWGVGEIGCGCGVGWVGVGGGNLTYPVPELAGLAPGGQE